MIEAISPEFEVKLREITELSTYQIRWYKKRGNEGYKAKWSKTKRDKKLNRYTLETVDLKNDSK
jgi:hypothetical protein